ncbi:cellulose synthase subunit BcsC-related outer membrane protein [Candidatus Methylobacter oryzae]|uniref:Cellulose synthase operon C C-terminal domain-containing protein n=1 Tax=Candidatus Methylobacter oryzae TaxID=2497749 RepID=A0ABY3CHB1_9GAMM|nr:cellulose synthase subunit BcsC-related outer membrane protein [Candidatus Methylobacter oryzae]TRX03592.1 hypothetical protein EKO24_000400 [Candidatus Methylobacter oryzae]
MKTKRKILILGISELLTAGIASYPMPVYAISDIEKAVEDLEKSVDAVAKAVGVPKEVLHKIGGAKAALGKEDDVAKSSADKTDEAGTAQETVAKEAELAKAVSEDKAKAANVGFGPQLQAGSVKPEYLLKQQIVLAESSQRYDIAESALERWLSIDRNDPEALFLQARVNFLKGDSEQAKKNILEFEKKHPNHPQLNKLKSLFETVGPKKLQLQQAHFLAGNRRLNEAIAIYESLFPYGMPTTAIEIEYLTLISKRSDSDHESAKKLIQERDIQYPENPEFKLALADIITQKTPDDKESLAVYEQLSHIDLYKKQVSSSWKKALSNIPIEKLTKEEIDNLVTAYPDDVSVDSKTKELRTALESYKKLMNDPAYQAQLRGFKLLDEGKFELAEKAFLSAKTSRFNDPQLYNGLGRACLNQSKHEEALVFFMKGKQLDTNTDNDAEWSGLISTAKYWTLINRADKLVESNKAEAISLYKQGIELNPKEVTPYITIAKILAKDKAINEADAFFIRALNIENNNREALLGRINLRADNGNIAEALLLADQLPAEQRKLIADEIADVKIGAFVNASEAALNNNDLKEANSKINQALSLSTQNPWLAYQVANILNSLNRRDDADRFVSQLLENSQSSPDLYFASALYLAKHNKLREALLEMDKIDVSERSPGVIRNQQRIWLEYQFGLLDSLIKHDKKQAVVHLKAIEPEVSGDPERLIKVANYWLDMDDSEHAKKIFNALAQDATWPLDTTLAYAELAFKLKDFEKLSNLETKIDLSSASIDQQLQYRKLLLKYKTAKAKQYLDQGNKIAANQLYFAVMQEDPMFISVYNQLAKLTENASDKNAKALPKSWVENHIQQLANPDAYSDFPIIKKIQILLTYGQLEVADKMLQEMANDESNEERALYDASQIALTIKKWDTAEKLSFIALKKNKTKNAIEDAKNSANSNAPVELDDNDKKQLYLTKDDDWLAKNAKSDIDVLRKKTDGYVTVAPDYRFGTNTTSTSIPVEVKVPFKKLGHFLVRVEPISLDAADQDLSTLNNAKNYGSSQFCFPNCGQQQATMQAQGVGYNIGWIGSNWKVDIGRTPENFLVTDVVGGVRLDGDIDAFSWAVVASRRPVTNTTLSYAGLVDPNTKKVWGGARQTGVGFNLGFDNGSPIGVWSSWQYHKITGENIQDNTKFMGQIGTYWGVWKDPSNMANVDLGLNTLYMSYKSFQDELTFGHGGYFSPQSYASISLPITVYGRYSGWSYSVRLSGAYSVSKVDDAPYYPNNPDLQLLAESQQGITGISPVYVGGSSNATSYGISSIVEKRLTDHWSIGAKIQIQRSPFYNPSNIGLYMKYDFNEHWKSIETPPIVPETFASY